jgi:hypothetical protein
VKTEQTTHGTVRPVAQLSPGDPVVLRWIGRQQRIVEAIPSRCVTDTDGLFALYIADGTRFVGHPVVAREGRAAVALSGGLPPRTISARRWRNHLVRLMYPGEPYSVWIAWNDAWELVWYYVNIEAPFVRTPIGVDTRDQVLDIAVSPDRTWRFKDDDELDAWVKVGAITADFAAKLWEIARDLSERVSRWGAPFCDGWETWRPPDRWAIPTLTKNWDQVPITLPRFGSNRAAF